MVSDILMAADTDPTISVGGILETIGGNIRVGNSPYFVTEACEYTNSFLSFFPKISIILNVEEDHMDFFHNLQEIRDSFHTFAGLLPEDGLLVINADIENYAELCQDLPCKVLTFGKVATCNYYPTNISYNKLGHISATVHTTEGEDFTLELSVPGEHNLANALAAMAVSDYLDIDRSIALAALKVFKGSKRRFEYKGSLGSIDIIDDYAHHPTEITATLTAAKNFPHGRVWCIFQPHTFTRTKAFMDEFAQALSLADEVILADIYPARETDNLGISSRDLQTKMAELGKKAHYFSTFDAIENFLLENLIHNDMVITMGAGDIVKVGEKLLGM
jgi:UDP-N-acetylmuramate--alanine ligase